MAAHELQPYDAAGDPWAKTVIGRLAAFRPVLDGLTRARNPIELRAFVLGRHDDRVQQYKQAVVECAAKEAALAEAMLRLEEQQLKRRQTELRLAAVTGTDEVAELERRRLRVRLTRIDNETRQTNVAMVGALKEVENFIDILETDYADLLGKTEEELLASEAGYWTSRLAKQVAIDRLAGHGVSAGNLAALWELPPDLRDEALARAMELEHEWTTAVLPAAEREAQRRLATSTPRALLLDEGKRPAGFLPLKLFADAPADYPAHLIVRTPSGEPLDRADVMIATLHRPGDQAWLSSRFFIPTGMNYVLHTLDCPAPELIGEYRNRIVLSALSLHCRLLFFVDDDLLAGDDTLVRLYQRVQADPGVQIVGGLYPKKQPGRPEAASMRLVPGGHPEPIPPQGEALALADWALTCGLTLYDCRVFEAVPYPWFRSSDRATEDTFATQRFAAHGIASYADPTVQAVHVDQATGQRYAFGVPALAGASP